MQIEITEQYLTEQGLSKTFPERFWAKVDKTGPAPKDRPKLGNCWNWIANRNTGGYGIIRAGAKTIVASRASWIIHHGPIPENTDVLHHCDNPACVNPDHLWVGTAKENMRDMYEKGRQPDNRGRFRGEKNPMRKLSLEKAVEIKRRVLSGEMQELIAIDFNVSIETVSQIKRGTRWGWIKPHQPPALPKAPMLDNKADKPVVQP